MVSKRYKKLALKSDGTLQEVQFPVSTRKLPLYEIRKRELQRCEQLGIVRGHPDAHYEGMTDQYVKVRLKRIGENSHYIEEGLKAMQRRELLIKYDRTRHLMI